MGKNCSRLLRRLRLLAMTPIMVIMPFAAIAAEETPYELQGVGVTEHFGDALPLEVTFTNEDGVSVPLKQYINGAKPVILTLVYYECPMLCGLVLQGFTNGLRDLSWTPGNEFEVVTISIDPSEDAELATAKKASVLGAYGRPEAAAGWHFLTGSEANIRAVADAVGFQYRYDAASKEFAHAAALTVLTPEGQIARYLYGVQYPARDLRLALFEAGQGKIGTVVDHILFYCYRYDPTSHKYGLWAIHVLQVAAAITVVAIGTGVWMMSRRRRTA